MADSGEVRVAYQVVGHGRGDVALIARGLKRCLGRAPVTFNSPEEVERLLRLEGRIGTLQATAHYGSSA